MLANSESQLDDRSSLSSASSSPAPACAQFQNGSPGSPIVVNEKLSRMFNAWRYEEEQRSNSGKADFQTSS